MNLREQIQQHKNEFDSEQMSATSDVIFKEKLKKELHQPKKSKVVYLRFVSVAASIILILSVVFWMQNSELSAETKEVLAFLTDHRSLLTGKFHPIG